MLEKSQIAQLNSRNISKDMNHTKAVVSQIWNHATNDLKQKAVELGSYQNTKSFHPAKISGQISVRMAVVLAIVYGVNPFYITGEKNNDGGFTENTLQDFLNQHGFAHIASSNDALVQTDSPKANNSTTHEETTLNEKTTLSEEEVLTLIKAHFIESKLGNKTSVEKLDSILKILAEH